MQSGFVVILLARQADKLLQIMWIIFLQHVTPFVILRTPADGAVLAYQRQRQAPVVAVVQMKRPFRNRQRLHLRRHLFRRQAAPGQPLPVFIADNPGAQLSFQAVQHRPQCQLLRQAPVLCLRLFSRVRDPGGPSTISSQTYAYSVQRTPHYTFLPTAHGDLALPTLLRVTLTVMVIMQSISLPNSTIICRKPDRSSSLF